MVAGTQREGGREWAEPQQTPVLDWSWKEGASQPLLIKQPKQKPPGSDYHKKY